MTVKLILYGHARFQADSVPSSKTGKADTLFAA